MDPNQEPIEIKNDEEEKKHFETDIKYPSNQEYEPDWECPICKEIMRQPVKLNGVSVHSFWK